MTIQFQINQMAQCVILLPLFLLWQLRWKVKTQIYFSKLWQFSITIEEEKDKNILLNTGTFSKTIKEEKDEGKNQILKNGIVFNYNWGLKRGRKRQKLKFQNWDIFKDNSPVPSPIGRQLCNLRSSLDCDIL